MSVNEKKKKIKGKIVQESCFSDNERRKKILIGLRKSSQDERSVVNPSLSPYFIAPSFLSPSLCSLIYSFAFLVFFYLLTSSVTCHFLCFRYILFFPLSLFHSHSKYGYHCSFILHWLTFFVAFLCYFTCLFLLYLRTLFNYIFIIAFFSSCAIDRFTSKLAELII